MSWIRAVNLNMSPEWDEWHSCGEFEPENGMSWTQAVNLNVFLKRDEFDSSSGIGYDPRKGFVGLGQGHWIWPNMGTTRTHPRTLDMTKKSMSGTQAVPLDVTTAGDECG
jgi:hypothetical protein